MSLPKWAVEKAYEIIKSDLEASYPELLALALVKERERAVKIAEESMACPSNCPNEIAKAIRNEGGEA